MKQNLMKSFFIDHITGTIAFFSANLLICVFYSIISEKRLEILYPFFIVLFVYLIWMSISFIHYRKLYLAMEEIESNTEDDTGYHRMISKKVIMAMNNLHHDYQDKLAITQNAANKERRFLSLWVHNMKTPVTVTDVLLQRMEQSDIDTEAAMNGLKQENNKLLYNLDTILNMIRLEDFAKDYIPEPINLLDEVKEIINKNKNLFIYSHIYPKMDTEVNEPMILSDRKWNELLIAQIISNAVKYSKQDQEVAQNIYFTIVREEHNYVLTIRDEGVGIPEHDLSRVYEAFFTGDNGRKGYHSSGIGLYFCKEVCKLLGHSLVITSKVDQGTTVKITYLAKL